MSDIYPGLSLCFLSCHGKKQKYPGSGRKHWKNSFRRHDHTTPPHTSGRTHPQRWIGRRESGAQPGRYNGGFVKYSKRRQSHFSLRHRTESQIVHGLATASGQHDNLHDNLQHDVILRDSAPKVAHLHRDWTKSLQHAPES